MFVGGECRGGPTRSHDYREYCYEAMNLIDTYSGDVFSTRSKYGCLFLPILDE